MNTQRLQALSEYLRTISPEQFAFDKWITKIKRHNKFLGFGGQIDSCNTVACGLGWAGLMPEFNKQGFRVEGYAPTYNGHTGIEAGQYFFGISHTEATKLFSLYTGQVGLQEYDHEKLLTYGCEASEVTPEMVADAIDALIQSKTGNVTQLTAQTIAKAAATTS